MTDSQCVDYLENICKMFVNGNKNCEGQALEYQQMYISAIRYAISKLQSLEERPQGEWKETGYETGALGITYRQTQCSNCGWEHALPMWWNFCPNCGAKMQKGGAE